MSDVTLSAAVRSSLLSLQDTTNLVERTQNRLSTGLRVSSAIDDPVAFFQAKSLTDRANDFIQRKDGIDQGVSTVTAALDAVDSIESLTQQLKGLAQSLKSATSTQFADLVSQFSDLRSQISNLTTDATYQGTNLVNGTGQTLTVEFSEKTASLLTVNSVDLTQTGLGINDVAAYSAGDSLIEVNYNTAQSLTVAANTTITSFGTAAAVSGFTNSFTFTYRGSDETFTSTGNFQISYGTNTLTIAVQTGVSAVITQGTVLSLGVITGTDSAFLATTASGAAVQTGFAIVDATTLSRGTAGTVTAASLLSTATLGSVSADNQTNFVSETDTTSINALITELDTALTTLRSNAATLGSNVALLQTRLDFTENYVNTLESGSAKLTLADINEEGANLLALQTRQQLGISSLSFAGQAEQSILQLFN